MSYLLEVNKIKYLKRYVLFPCLKLFLLNKKEVLRTSNSKGIKEFLTGRVFSGIVTCSFIDQKSSWEKYSNSIIILIIVTCWVPLMCQSLKYYFKVHKWGKRFSGVEQCTQGHTTQVGGLEGWAQFSLAENSFSFPNHAVSQWRNIHEISLLVFRVYFSFMTIYVKWILL